MRESKKNSLKKFVFTITWPTPSKTVWNKIKQTKDIATSYGPQSLLMQNTLIYNEKDIALGSKFEKSSSDSSYNLTFQEYKISSENIPLTLTETTPHPINDPLTLQELDEALANPDPMIFL